MTESSTVETNKGKIKISDLHRMSDANRKTYKVKSYNSNTKIFEYHTILDVTCQTETPLHKIHMQIGPNYILGPQYQVYTEKGWVDTVDCLGEDILYSTKVHRFLPVGHVQPLDDFGSIYVMKVECNDNFVSDGIVLRCIYDL